SDSHHQVLFPAVHQIRSDRPRPDSSGYQAQRSDKRTDQIKATERQLSPNSTGHPPFFLYKDHVVQTSPMTRSECYFSNIDPGLFPDHFPSLAPSAFQETPDILLLSAFPICTYQINR